MSEDVTVEVETQDTPVAEVKDVKVESLENDEAENTDDKSQEEAEAEEQEPVKTVEERLAEIERDVQVKQKKIDRQTAAYKALQDKYQREMQEFQAMQKKLQPEQEVKEPDIDDFDTHEDYLNAVRKHEREQGMKEAQNKLIQDQQKQKAEQFQRERMAIADKQTQEYLAINPKYEQSREEFMTFVSTLNVSPEVESAITDQAFETNVAQVIDYFAGNGGENLDKLEQISRLPAHKAAVEIYKIQQKLGVPEKKEIKTPPKPVNSPSSNAKGKKSLDDLDPKEMLKQLGLR